MSYETTLFLLAAPGRGKHRKLASALAQEQARKGVTDPDSELNFLLRHIAFGSDGSLQFRPNKRRGLWSDEVPDDEGLVLSVWGGWEESEELARWLCAHGAEGQVILHSREGDGEAWGHEFRNGKMRDLALVPVGKWKRVATR
jgi:hypothetical protein